MVDCSGSMSKIDFDLENVLRHPCYKIEAANVYVGTLTDYASLDMTDVLEDMLVFANDIDMTLNSFERSSRMMSACGGTNTAEALTNFMRYLRNNPTIDPTNIIIVTDGEDDLKGALRRSGIINNPALYYRVMFVIVHKDGDAHLVHATNINSIY